MGVTFDVAQYVASVRMSTKKRVLVEGKSDKGHVTNLLMKMLSAEKIQVDSADQIRGNCAATATSSAAKIDKIHSLCRGRASHANLFMLRDREFIKFQTKTKIIDLMAEHETDGNLAWTIGHSFENYFLDPAFLVGAFRHLCPSPHKVEACTLFESIFPSAMEIVASVTLAARDVGASGLPNKLLGWSEFRVDNGALFLDVDACIARHPGRVTEEFRDKLRFYAPLVAASDPLTRRRIARGHTAVVLLQRVFAYCLFLAAGAEDEALRRRDANDFSNVRESLVAAALCEVWLQQLDTEGDAYPKNLTGLLTS